MSIKVWTAKIVYSGPDALNITRKSAGEFGLCFAPSWDILGPLLRIRHGGMTRRIWDKYVSDYTAEMRVSYKANRWAWDRLLRMEEATLTCYCQEPARCHRTVMAGILGKMGATVMGERPVASDGNDED